MPVSERSKAICARLREIRIDQKKTIDHVANRLGLSGAAIVRYEKGDREPRLDTLGEWMAVLGLELEINARVKTESTMPPGVMQYVLESGMVCKLTDIANIVELCRGAQDV